MIDRRLYMSGKTLELGLLRRIRIGIVVSGEKRTTCSMVPPSTMHMEAFETCFTAVDREQVQKLMVDSIHIQKTYVYILGMASTALHMPTQVHSPPSSLPILVWSSCKSTAPHSLPFTVSNVVEAKGRDGREGRSVGRRGSNAQLSFTSKGILDPSTTLRCELAEGPRRAPRSRELARPGKAFLYGTSISFLF